MSIRHLLCASILPCLLLAQAPNDPPAVLPAMGTAALAKSLEASTRHAKHVWRDSRPLNEDGTVNAYVEIPRGERRKSPAGRGRLESRRHRDRRQHQRELIGPCQ